MHLCQGETKLWFSWSSLFTTVLLVGYNLYTPDSIYVNKTKGAIKNGSRDTLGTQNTGQSQRQTKQKTQHWKLKRWATI